MAHPVMGTRYDRRSTLLASGEYMAVRDGYVWQPYNLAIARRDGVMVAEWEAATARVSKGFV